MSWFDVLFWAVLLLVVVQPAVSRRLLEAKRVAALRTMEDAMGSRLILMLHRTETMGILGFPLVRFLDIQDSEEVLRAIRMTDDDLPISVIIHTPGGLALAATQIAEALRAHPAPVTAFVPHYAMSGGTLIALAADQIVMDPAAVLGQVDPQLDELPAAALVRLLEHKDVADLDDGTLIQVDIARRALRQMSDQVRRLLPDDLDEDAADRIIKALATGEHTHDHPIRADEAQAMGLVVSTDFPEQLHELMSLYPQAGGGQTGIHFVPLPYSADPPPRH